MKKRIFFCRHLTETQLERLRKEGCSIRDLNRRVNTWIGYQGWSVTVHNERQLTMLMLTVDGEFLVELDIFRKRLDGN
jgi:hypothetical protein